MNRFTLPCLVAVLLGSCAIAGADEIYVPANQLGTSRNRYPFDARFSPEWRYQLVIPPKYLGGEPFEIRDVSFLPYENGTFSASQFEVRIAHTTAPTSATFDANLPNPVTVLFAENFKWTTTHQQWSPIRLAGTFTYDGKSGLCIEIRYAGGAWTRFTGYCYSSWPIHDRVWAYGSGAYTATTGTVGSNTGLHVRLTVVKARIDLSATPLPGFTINLHLEAPSGAGSWYQVGSSLGHGPIPLGPRRLWLALDPLLAASTSGTLPGLFQNYRGKLDANGAAKAKLAIPNLAFLKGQRFYTAFVTFDPQAPLGVGQISSSLPITIQ